MPYRDDESREAARARLEARRGNAARTSGRTSSDARRSRQSQTRSANDRRRSGQGRERGQAASSARRSSQANRAQSTRSAQSGRAQQRGAARSSSSRGDSRARYESRSSQRESLPASIYHGFEGILPDAVPPVFAISVVLLVIFLVATMIIVPSCNRAAAESAARSTQIQGAGQAEPANGSPAETEQFAFDPTGAYQSQLAKILGEETATKLLKKATTNSDALWIAAHADRYAFDGSDTQYKILKLAADEDAALPFVRAYPSVYPLPGASSDGSIAMSSASPSADVRDTDIPHLYQWDERWGNTSFANTAFGLSGGGPTCLAMVTWGLTGDTSKTPYDIGKAAQDEKAFDEKVGMKREYLYDTAKGLGLKCSELYPSYEIMRDALLTGNAIILVMEPGSFSSTESFVVLTGLSDDGRVIMNDPNSVEHSSQLWDLDEFVAAAQAMYVYSV